MDVPKFIYLGKCHQEQQVLLLCQSCIPDSTGATSLVGSSVGTDSQNLFAKLWIQRRVPALTFSNMTCQTFDVPLSEPASLNPSPRYHLFILLQRLTLTSKLLLSVPFHTQLPQTSSSALCPQPPQLLLAAVKSLQTAPAPLSSNSTDRLSWCPLMVSRVPLCSQHPTRSCGLCPQCKAVAHGLFYWALLTCKRLGFLNTCEEKWPLRTEDSEC